MLLWGLICEIKSYTQCEREWLTFAVCGWRFEWSFTSRKALLIFRDSLPLLPLIFYQRLSTWFITEYPCAATNLIQILFLLALLTPIVTVSFSPVYNQRQNRDEDSPWTDGALGSSPCAQCCCWIWYHVYLMQKASTTVQTEPNPGVHSSLKCPPHWSV